MRSTPWILSAIAGTLLLASGVNAEELKMTDAPETSGHQPARGLSMEKVEAAYGAPESRVPAVGNPPITRWEYPTFTVFFEHNIVLHTVVKP
jgi:hypothetical protein